MRAGAAASSRGRRRNSAMAEAWSLAAALRSDGAAVPRAVAEEMPVAMVYDGTSHAVLLASPTALEDFALGFSLAEGIIGAAAELLELEVVQRPIGIELRMRLAPGRGDALAARRRAMAGPVGCGLCGLVSLEAALPAPPRVGTGPRLAPAQVFDALAQLTPAQALNRTTSAVHAAAFFHPDRGLLALAEDVGRHNALDKLLGQLARRGLDPAAGFVALTSRVSVELVQKAAMAGVTVLVAISAPTALALRTAEAAGITLVGVARGDAFEVFTQPQRIPLPPRGGAPDAA